MGSFWATLKAVCADEPFTDVKDARSKIFADIVGWYNRQRRHSALGYHSPEQYTALNIWTQ